MELSRAENPYHISELADAQSRASFQKHTDDGSQDAAAARPRPLQSRSCDHCRLGKRRCDVRVRLKKQCTVEARERHSPIPTRYQRRKSTPDTGSGVTPLQETSTTFGPWSPVEPSSASSVSPEFWLNQDLQTASQWFSPQATLDHLWPSATMAGSNSQGYTFDPDLNGIPSPAMTSVGSSMFSVPYKPPTDYIEPATSRPVPADYEPDRLLRSSPAGTTPATKSTTSTDRQRHKRPSYRTPTRDREVSGQEEGRLTPRTAIRYKMFHPSSPMASHLLAKDFSRVQIKEGLLKIYRDSMEGALSCWLTERNCPYSFSPFNGKDLLDGRDVWGSNWASRMVMRVCALDHEYAKAGALSKRDQQQGSQILNLVVMAFAAQWSQAGRRHESAHTDYSSTSDTTTAADQRCPDPPMQQLGEESFGRNTQKALWHKANRALSEASDNTSFQAIFAGIIFSLTQRPIDGKEVLEELQPSGTDELDSLFKVLDLDGPTSSLDAANRKMHDHRRKLRETKSPGMYNIRALPTLSDAHEETFGLLYWLAVMFDTLSAAINRRSFTISDSESSFSHAGGSAKPSFIRQDYSRLPQTYMTPEHHAINEEVAVWGDYFLREQSRTGQLRSQNTRWPCSYGEAASCLADAAPVKVLLYRRLGQLQSLYYQGALPQLIENGLEATVEVYNHWNNTYGLFLDDCLRNHEALPARIQSWYTLLTGHWNLAVLIFVDLIDTMDSVGMTLATHASLRKSIRLIGHLRDTAVHSISELGRCCRSGEQPLAFTQSSDFHHAVNKAALLTEPWTMVLVKAFGYAGAILARRLSLEEHAEPGSTTRTYSKERLQYCIDALSLLGKKSDMAMCSAELLSRYAKRQ